MEQLKKTLLFSFQTKVIIPMVVVMVILLAVCMTLISKHVTRLLQDNAEKRLVMEDAMFHYLQDHQDTERLLRYQSVVAGKNSSLRPLITLFASDKDAPKTVRGSLNELINQNIADVIGLAVDNDRVISVARDPRLDLDRFENDCSEAFSLAAQDQPKSSTVQNGDRLYDIVAVPIRVGDSVAGSIVFGVENTSAAEFKKHTGDELVLFSDGKVIASTLLQPGVQASLAEEYRHVLGNHGKNINPISDFSLADEHYRSFAGLLTSGNDPHQLGYLILSSYEKSLQALHATQRLILFSSIAAILIGTAGVWFFVRRVMHPLRELRDSAEAVGKGDFSQRVPVRSNDECGELAFVFNHMTQNLENSHAELKTTVESLKSTQEQLVQSEKLAGIGEFVAGVAHELNNPLTSVMGFSELLAKGDVDSKHKRHLEMIHKSAARCQKIVQNLLSFARHHQPERKLVCVNKLIEDASDILQYQMRTSNIQFISELNADLPKAMVDPHQLQQVFLNIINNARQAIEEFRPNGWIRVRTEVAGENIRILIRDNGPGIPAESISKIFDPFYTTKSVGKGTGLGLSLCYGIVKEHGGSIHVSSKMGSGAAFVIELPIAPEGVEVTEHEAELPPENNDEGSGKKVLVIDDEELILQMVSEVLGRCGYEVDVAGDGETALNRMRYGTYDLALCDWKMPGLNGEQVYERLRAVNPVMSDRMIFITGDVINTHTQKFLRERNKICLSKPFSVAEFRTAINQALARQ